MNSLDLVIRPVTFDDAIPLASLQARVFALTYGAAIPRPTLETYLDHIFAPEQIAAELNRSDSMYLVAAHNGTIIGVSKLIAGAPADHQLPNAVELARLYIDAEWHGCGVASALLKVALASAREQGYASVWLCVWQRNARAISFYRKHGFVVFGHTPVFVDDTRFDDLLMRRNLDDC